MVFPIGKTCPYIKPMADSAFHLDNTGSLTLLKRERFVSERDLQSLIARHPALLARESETEGPRFMVERSGPSPVVSLAAARWSVDHLFLTADALPIIVETQWSADSRPAGDLLGQVLYYAANAAAWWPVETLRASFAKTRGLSASEADALLSNCLGGRASPEAYWAQVSARLAAGRILIVLVVDCIRPELAKMMTFLGEHLRDAEVRLLEARQHVGPSGRLLRFRGWADETAHPAITVDSSPAAAPTPPSTRTVGLPEPTAASDLGPGEDRNARRDAWVDALRSRCDQEEALALDGLLRWMGEQYGATFLADLATPTFRLAVKEAGKDRYPFGVTDTKMAAIHLGALATSRAFEGDEARRALIEEVTAAGLAVASADIGEDVRLPLKSLAEPDKQARLLAVLDGIVESLRLKEALNAFPVRR
jgi:hypothetical protein